jgi:hypothetical protein
MPRCDRAAPPAASPSAASGFRPAAIRRGRSGNPVVAAIGQRRTEGDLVLARGTARRAAADGKKRGVGPALGGSPNDPLRNEVDALLEPPEIRRLEESQRRLAAGETRTVPYQQLRRRLGLDEPASRERASPAED